jgi:hypothetical protein
MFILFYLISILKVTRTNDIWTWLGEEFASAIKEIPFYNGLEQNTFIKDFSSVLISYPVMRQARIKNSNFVIF